MIRLFNPRLVAAANKPNYVFRRRHLISTVP